MKTTENLIKELRSYPAHYTAAHEAADKLDGQRKALRHCVEREKYLKGRIERLKKKLGDNTPEVTQNTFADVVAIMESPKHADMKD